MPLSFSVCMCTYNGEKYLASQLESIVAQKRLPDELIVCDDGSKDSTLTVLDGFAARAPFPFRIYRNSKNTGVTRNFEQAVGLAQGHIIVTADQDDIWYSNKLAQLEKEFENTSSVGLAFSDAELVDGEGQQLGRRLWRSVKFPASRVRAVEQGNAFATLLRRSAVTGAAMAFRAEHRDLILPIPPEWFHDEWIALLVSAVARLKPVAEPLMAYRLHGGNQAGVYPDTFTGRAQQSIQTPKSYYRSVCERFEKLRMRLLYNNVNRPELVASVERKIRHFQVRAELPQSRLRRAPIVLRELIRLGYTRYSGTTLSCIRDMWS
jgi:glycosyltransferase involved in cell wall biosynthesis